MESRVLPNILETSLSSKCSAWLVNRDSKVKYMNDVAKILKEYSWIYSVRNVDIFLYDVLENISQEDDWPDSLKSFIKECLRLGNKRFPSNNWIDLVCLPKLENMKKTPYKKQYEIDVLSDLIYKVCQETGCYQVLDVGSGLGYLDQTLHHLYGVRSVCLDSCSNYTKAAIERIKQDPCSKSMHHKTFKVDGSETCLKQLKDILLEEKSWDCKCKFKNNFQENGGKFDMRMSNRVYNSLRQFSVAEKKRGKVHDKQDIATTQKALDAKTHLILFKLLNNETLESVSGCISTGKESCVYHAWSGLPVEECSFKEFAVKVYKTTLCEFRNRQEYIKNDRRFCDRFARLNPRRIIHLWAEKEMRNLLRIKDANIPCPEVIALKKHVLVMTFIGGETQPAPKIKDVQLPFEDMTIMYEQVVEILKLLYNSCNLVHADLSEYNLLWYQDKVWVIDVGQAVETNHPEAHNFLLRDCTNVVTFFDKRGVLNIPKPEELLLEVTGKTL